MMKLLKLGGVTAVLTTLIAALAACTPTSSQPAPPTRQPTAEPERPSLDLPDLGAAPEIENETWINSEAPVRLAASRGKVVLLEFWTFG